jgi:hypothetical protein
MSFFGKLFEDPLKTAAIGAGLYFTGGALAPALGLGGAGAAGLGATTVDALGQIVPVAAGEVGGASGGLAAGAGGTAGGGLLNMAKDAMGYAKPFGEAASAASAAKGLLSEPQTPAPTPWAGAQGGSQVLAQLAQNQISPEEQAMLQARMQRKSQWG